MNEELNELNVIGKPFCLTDKFWGISKSQTCRINSIVNEKEKVKILICEFGLILFFFLVLFIFKMWSSWISWEHGRIMNNYLSWCMKRPYISMQLSSTKGFRGLSLLMEWEGWREKIFRVRWAWSTVTWCQFF